jgi:glycosyltransferase involved in cell wall biosynthesis
MAPMKKTILHFIHNLGRGGAEVMMVKVIKELKEYNNIVVTLSPQNHFDNELECDKLICLNARSILFFPVAVLKLRKIIRQYKVDVVHTHLFWPTIIARLGTPSRIPLVTTIHAFIATSIEYKKSYVRILDKITYYLRKNIIITVAKGATKEYFSFLKLKPYKAFSLYTFVDTRQFNDSHAMPSSNVNGNFRLISVGALRVQKNHKFLLEAFKKLADQNFELDIYGEGPLDKELQHSIDTHGLKVNLKGEVNNIAQLINQYDVFVMSSTFEGFSLSVLEAMAMKMPLLLSDIKSFREQCADTASYFELDNVNDFVTKIKGMAADKSKLRLSGICAKERALNNFTIDKHMDGLRKIYKEVMLG